MNGLVTAPSDGPNLTAGALLRLISGQILLHACMTGIRMAGPLLALKQGYSAAAVGVLGALFALTPVFLALPAARLADRYGLQRPVHISVAAACVGALLAALWPVFPVLCVSALLAGAAASATQITVQRHVGRMAADKAQLRKAFSWQAIAPAGANFLGPLLAGLVIDHAAAEAGATVAFRWAFALLAVLPLITALSFYRLPEKPIAPSEAMQNGQQKAWDLLRDPAFRNLLLVNWFLSSCWDVHTFIVPVLGHELGLSASVIGTLLGTFAVAAVAVRMLLPVLLPKAPEWKVIVTAMVATAGFLALYPLMPNPWAMGACAIGLGFALGSVQPMVMSTLHTITPPARQGEAMALRVMAINGSSVMMPMLFGTLSTLIGAAGVFWCVSVWVGFGTRLGLRLRQNPETAH